MPDLTFSDIITSPEQLMGIKAVWGRSEESVMCFGARGDPNLKDRRFYATAKSIAERAQRQPYLLTIGAGAHVPNEIKGRVLELVRATGAYGETSAFVRDPHLMARLIQWPTAIIVSEVYTILGEPHLVDDLGFPDQTILANAFDGVIHPEERIDQLWAALRHRDVSRRWDVPLPPGFRDPGKVQLCGSMYPRLDATSSEGKRVWKLQQEIETAGQLKRDAKALNKARNLGQLKCEACGFSDPVDGIFDVHHLQPLALGVRETRVDDLAVLCPLCHRWAHAKAADRLSPLPIKAVGLALGRLRTGTP